MKHRGIVEWFDIEKGFGFVKSEDFDSLLFLHFSSIETNGFKYVNPKEVIEFEAIAGNRGWQISKAKRV